MEPAKRWLALSGRRGTTMDWPIRIRKPTLYPLSYGGHGGRGHGAGPATAAGPGDRLELRSRAVCDFLGGLVALRLLDREGSGEAARYANTSETAVFLDTNSPQYIGGILEMANARLYGFWDGLTDALRTGEPQNEIKHTGKSMFEELYADPARLEQFMRAMSGYSYGNFEALS